MVFRPLLLASICVTLAHAHLAAWHPGMYCLNGATNVQNLNSQDIVTPLWQLSQSDWWFHHVNGCDDFPPPDGQFLELPAGQDFTVEIAANRAKTTLSYNGRDISDWPDGEDHPDDYVSHYIFQHRQFDSFLCCLVECPNMHYSTYQYVGSMGSVARTHLALSAHPESIYDSRYCLCNFLRVGHQERHPRQPCRI